MTRTERIRQAVKITDLLAELGYGVQPSEREQQFGCDLHGTRDSKPSARVYPQNNSTYCFACGKSRDVIRTVMDKLDLDFKASMAWLEKTYNLSAWQGRQEEPAASLTDTLNATFAPPEETLERALVQVRTLLDGQKYDRILSCKQTMALWAEVDIAADKQDVARLHKIRDKILQKVKDVARLQGNQVGG